MANTTPMDDLVVDTITRKRRESIVAALAVGIMNTTIMAALVAISPNLSLKPIMAALVVVAMVAINPNKTVLRAVLGQSAANLNV
jgi:hypothetical protein